MGFTKLDSNIVQSSIMLEPPEVFKVWIAFLATCDSDGISRVSAVFIASVCHFSIEDTLKYITVLENPDPLSRSINDEGRRLRRVDGGYEIINYKKYREYTYSNSPEAIKKRHQRGHKGDMSRHSGDILSSVLSNNSSLIREDCKERNRHSIPPTVEEITVYCNQRQNSIVPQTFFDFYESKGWMVGKSKMKDWQASVRTWEKSENRKPQQPAPKKHQNWTKPPQVFEE